MSMLQHYYAPQRRRFNVNTWMPSTAPRTVFGSGMSPLECFMPSMLDIFQPLLSNLGRGIGGVGRQRRQRGWSQPRKVRRNVRNVNVGKVRSTSQLRMIQPSYQPSYKPSYGGGAISHAGFQKPMLPKSVLSRGMPQKYRICIDCCGFNQQAIRTCVKQINGVYHLIVNCCSGSGRQERGVRGYGSVTTEFRRSYTLPRNCDIKKMCTYMCNGIFVVEFPLLEQPIVVKCAKLKPTVVKCQGTKMVSLRVPISELINRTNLQCFIKDRDLILRFEYKIQPDTVSRVYCYTKIALPAQANLNQLKCKLNKKRLLTVCAPLVTTRITRPTMAKFRCVHIERKLRHRISGKQPLIQIGGKPTIHKKKGITGVKKPITGRKTVGGKQQFGVGGKQLFGGKQQIGGKKQGIVKKTSGVFGKLFGEVPEKSKQVTHKEKKPEVQKKKTTGVKQQQVGVSGKPIKKTPSGLNIKKTPSGANIKKTPSGTNIRKTSSGRNLSETGGKQGTKETGKRGSETLHRIIGQQGQQGQVRSGERKSPEVERRGSPEAGRKSPISSGL